MTCSRGIKGSLLSYGWLIDGGFTMNLYYGIAVVVRLLFALLIGDKPGAAYLWYLLQELLGIQAEKKENENTGAVTTPEPMLRPVRG